MRLSASLLSPLNDLPDRALLGRFLAEHDEAAFAGLVHRHGPMVLGVCRRVLGDVHAAADAFQATFLVLVRRAADATRDHLGPWLYGVAHRTALKARVAALRRANREQKAAAGRPVMAPAPSHGSPDVAELGSVLDEELGRLPGELRTAVVMCDLEGLSRREAARRLGCPESTLSSRLTQARDRLVRRLTRRGVAPVVAGLVAAVPPSLARATCAAAVSVLTGAPPGVPAPVAQLSNEVIRTMTLARKAVAALVASFAAVLVTGAAIVAGSGPPAPTGLPAAKVADPDDPPERKPADGLRFVAFDGFDGKLGLNWQPIRHDPSHVSLKKNAGKLTITTQKGTIHGEAEKGNPNLPAKNIYLIDNPLAKDRDFVVTTCVVEFRPEANYHQAGLILYDDDDNYLKFTFEFNSPKQAGVYAVVVNEQNAQPKHTPIEIDPEATRLWLRFTRKGASYEYATSIDGERFVSHGTTEWGKDGPKKIGLIAKNGGEKEVAELDAQFEFFELKAP